MPLAAPLVLAQDEVETTSWLVTDATLVIFALLMLAMLVVVLGIAVRAVGRRRAADRARREQQGPTPE